MAEFASKGVAGSGLGLGIAGTALGVLNSGAGLFGLNHPTCSENTPATRYDLGLERQISNKDAEIAYLRGQSETETKLLEVYKYFDGQVKDIRQQLCDNRASQGIINTRFESAIDVLGSQVSSINNTISNLTKTVIPNANVCPGWGSVCVQPNGCSCVNGYNANI